MTSDLEKITPAMAVAALIFLAWTSVMLPGFAFPMINNFFHVPIVLDYAASAEGPHDAFVASLSNFVSLFWPALRLIANERNIFWIFFAVHLLARLLLVGGFYALARHFDASRTAALAMAGLAGIAPVFKGISIVGHNELLPTYLSHTAFAVAMMPFCWLLLVRGRWIVAAALLGLMFNINAFMSIWSVLAAVVAIFLARGELPDFWRKLLLCGLAYVAAASPTIVWTLQTLARPQPDIDFRAYLKFYYPFHTFIHLQWEPGARYLAYVIAAGLAVTAALRQLGPGGKTFAAILATYAAVFAFGLPLPYLTGSRIILNLYPLRIDAVMNAAIAAILLAWAGRNLSGDRRDILPLAIALTFLIGNMVAALVLLHAWSARLEQTRFVRAIRIAAVVVLLLLLAMAQRPELEKAFLPLTLLFCLAALSATAAAWREQRNIGTLAVATAALAGSFLPFAPGYPWPMIGIAVATGVALSGSRWTLPVTAASALLTAAWVFGTGDRMALIAVLALIAMAVVLGIPRADPLRRLAGWGVSAPVILGGIALFGLALTAYAGWRGSVERPDVDFASKRQAWAWARQTIPADQQLLEVNVSEFGIFSRRQTWVDEKAGAAVMWDPSYLAEWMPRMKEVKACADTACYAALARRHRIGWIVAEPGKLAAPEASGLRLRFANPAYQIYSVDGGGLS